MIKRNQNGMAALVVTAILISLLSAVAVAFATVMNRELQKSVNNQLGQAAYNAAASGINDAVSYLKDNPNSKISNCNDLLGTSKPLSASSNLSGNGGTKYTCVLIDPLPLDLVYQSVPANKSQVITASFSAISPNTVTIAGRMLISWQSNDKTTYYKYRSASEASGVNPQLLISETNWKAGNYVPMLKVSLYPIPIDTKTAAFAKTNAKTFYLYPTDGAGYINKLDFSATATGTFKPVACGLDKSNGEFNGSADYSCNLIINNLPLVNTEAGNRDCSVPSEGLLPASQVACMYYIQLTPIYGAANIKIRANDITGGRNALQFVNTQAVIDVTAQSSNAVKRLQARVDSSSLNGGKSQNVAASDNLVPEFALRSANTLCKRLVNPNLTDWPVYLDQNNVNDCPDLSGWTPETPPTVNVSCGNVGDLGGSCSAQIYPNNGKIITCTITVSPTAPNGDSQYCPTNPNPTKDMFTATWSASNLDYETTYTITFCASNPASPTPVCGSGTVRTANRPAPAPAIVTSFTQNTNCVYDGIKKGNCYNFTGSNLGNYPCSYTIDGGATQYGYTLSPDGTSGSFTYGSDGAVAKTGSITCSNTCNLGATCASVPGVPSINITYFITQGPYDNGVDQAGKYCPQSVAVTAGLASGIISAHRYTVCINWAITVTTDANPVSCTPHITVPGANSSTWGNQGAANSNGPATLTTSGSQTTGGDGWIAGADDPTSFISEPPGKTPKYSAGWIKCVGAGGLTATAIYNSPPEDVPIFSPTYNWKALPVPWSSYNYVLPYCGNTEARNNNKCVN